MPTDPIKKFKTWLRKAEQSEPNDPGAMCLSTVDRQGHPSSRMVLLKQVDDRGFVFYTNFNSQKGQELAQNPFASLCFYWKSLQKQVRVQGRVTPVSKEEADLYFQTRAHGSRIGAWASHQSQPLKTPFALQKNVAVLLKKYAFSEIPRPDYWSGFRLAPDSIEFWQHRASRLHKRKCYTKTKDGLWVMKQLYP